LAGNYYFQTYLQGLNGRLGFKGYYDHVHKHVHDHEHDLTGNCHDHEHEHEHDHEGSYRARAFNFQGKTSFIVYLGIPFRSILMPSPPLSLLILPYPFFSKVKSVL
jgi:ABC-type nickel/cobalt efflux system permease component RcnA